MNNKKGEDFMSQVSPEMLRNVGFFGHSGSGKTSLIEGLLYAAHAVDRLHSVAEGNSNLDFEEEEIKRKLTISSSCARITWNDLTFNVIDTPGDGNFFSDARNCMQGVDNVVLVVDAASGIKVNTEKAYELAKELELPIFIVINRLDKERGNFEEVLAQIKTSLDRDPIP